MTGTGDDTADRLTFGPFSLSVNQRLLVKEGVSIELGARAMDLLITLVSAPNKLVSKQDLILRVWPDVIVEEGSLRFHMTGLRKALGDGQDGALHHDDRRPRLLFRSADRSVEPLADGSVRRRFPPCHPSEPPRSDGRQGGRHPPLV